MKKVKDIVLLKWNSLSYSEFVLPKFINDVKLCIGVTIMEDSIRRVLSKLRSENVLNYVCVDKDKSIYIKLELGKPNKAIGKSNKEQYVKNITKNENKINEYNLFNY